MDRQPGHHHSDNCRISDELLALDCNLASLCDHTQSKGSNHGSFSDVILKAMGARYHLRRLIHSCSLSSPCTGNREASVGEDVGLRVALVLFPVKHNPGPVNLGFRRDIIQRR
ncbi:hypothetical protein HanPSC8_Chr13g0593421 [Helianthus annuus]|nr:hypothetical protein HanPSC8_Chr13g0593421 [Helianthus annuus]